MLLVVHRFLGRPLPDQSGSTTEMIPPVGNHGRKHSRGNGRPGDSGDALTSDMLELKMQIIRSLRIECSEDYMMLIVQRAALWVQYPLYYSLSNFRVGEGLRKV